MGRRIVENLLFFVRTKHLSNSCLRVTYIYIHNDIFFLWTHGKERLETFLQELNNFDSDFKFIYDSNKKEIPFLDLKVKLNEGKISTDLYTKYTGRH